MPALPASFARSLAAALIVAALLPAPAYAGAGPFALDNISVEVVDGDTLRLVGSRQLIRLFGVDACEFDQEAWTQEGQAVNCSSPAVKALRLWTSHRRVSCLIRSTDRYGRLLGVCQSDQIADFSAELIARGLALAYRYRARAVSAEYEQLEQQAKSEDRGLWELAFDEPWIHRRQK
ncbi:thermonuclease family protein [Phyllobacterium salinisoli]|nr:thermonuclease family protein [Phyllobacterium salinisoli]